jgi:hypothetical protein
MRLPTMAAATGLGLGLIFGITGVAAAQGGPGVPYSCDSVVPASDPSVAQRLSSLGVTASPDTLVGTSCTELHTIGVGRGGPTGYPFCATGPDTYNGVIVGGTRCNINIP